MTEAVVDCLKGTREKRGGQHLAIRKELVLNSAAEFSQQENPMGNLTDFLKLLIQEAAHPVLIGGAGRQGAKSVFVQRAQTLDLHLDAP